MTLSQNRPTVV